MVAVGRRLSGQGQREDLDHQDNRKPKWKKHEYRLRKHELRSGSVSVVVQFLVAVVALGTVIVALFATIKAAREAVDATREGIERQATENRLSTAISAIGADEPGARVGGLALLPRHVTSQLLAANESGTEQKRLEAHLLYTTALRVLENYLRNPPDGQVVGAGGLGYGAPDVPADNIYAARELQGMMRLRSEVEKLDVDALDIDASLYPAPTLDLANVELRGQSWPGIDFSWLAGGTSSSASNCGRRTLPAQPGERRPSRTPFCSVPTSNGAQFSGTDLRGADLRGTNISGANFRDANLGLDDDDATNDTKMDRVWYDGTKPPEGLAALPSSPQGDWEGRDTCMGRPALHTKPS